MKTIFCVLTILAIYSTCTQASQESQSPFHSFEMSGLSLTKSKLQSMHLETKLDPDQNQDKNLQTFTQEASKKDEE